MQKEEFSWLSTDECLQRFGQLRYEAMIAFQDYVNIGIGLNPEIDFEGGHAEGILGDDDFIEKVQERVQYSICPPALDFQALLSFIINWYKIHPEILQVPGQERRSSFIRSVMALIIRDTDGVSLKELAEFCDREASGMSRAAMRLEMRMNESSALRKEVESIKQELFSFTKCHRVS